jgi:hypothetical protein
MSKTFFVPGQQECDSFGKEWKGFERQAYKASTSIFWYFFITNHVNKEG